MSDSRSLYSSRLGQSRVSYLRRGQHWNGHGAAGWLHPQSLRTPEPDDCNGGGNDDDYEGDDRDGRGDD